MTPDPAAVARELDALAAEQTGGLRGELTRLAADIRLAERRLAAIVRAAIMQMAEIKDGLR